MLMLLGLALPLALLGFALDGGDDDTEDTEVIGTDGDDRIEGGEGIDFLDGQAGDDVMNGRAGGDTLFGREGEDVLQGEDGDDMLCSGDDNDVVTGNRGNDLIEGQGGDDFLSGDYGRDNVRGDEGNDTVLGGRGSDMVVGQEGDDVLFGGIINGVPLNLEEMQELRDGGSLADINGGIDMRDDSMGNTLAGGSGDDELVIGSFDQAYGGDGNDTFNIMSEQITPEDSANGAAFIGGFNSADDAITVIVDDTSVDADITVTNDNGDAIIRMGDAVLARVEGAAGSLSTGDITLIAENTIEAMFDPHGVAA
ncbi:calcium-binding protein [Sulfitobacter sp. F26169L]|uniref:calcium-binding protein n=1 Tax=Sulfitobacter sp. F26169L TaxID=2996015 RepID=UPI002260EE53|nr:calcium-binding protein [Sulfitobacter sp. F26169L]MCX7566183.1 calcium-binding protein [Sulfitobacter sp. F26169L]